jgi:radical SAM superfamily enzyme YgiQ (UPF0313 family)
MKNKILLVAINARYTHSNLALRYLRNYIADLDFNCELIEFTIKQFPQDILKNIYRSKPDIVAISVYIWNTEICKTLLSEIKKILPDTKIILGGPEVSYNANEWLVQFDSIDWIICGHGEAGFRYLLENNLSVQEKIIEISNPNFVHIPFPYLDIDFPEIQDKYIYYESSRGCPFKCSYCLSSRSDQSLEYKDLKQVKEELAWLIKQKPRIVKFVDRTFNADKIFAREIWKFLIEQNPITKFHFEIHPALLEDLDFELLNTASKDLFQFEIGIQSTNLETIKAINRQQNWSISKKNIQRLISINKFHIHVDLIVGLPFEDPVSLEQSFNEIISLRADHFQMGFLKILPGTEMAERKTKFEMQNFEKAPYEIISNKWLKYNEMIKLHTIEALLESIYNSGKFKITYKSLLTLYHDPYSFFYSLAEFYEALDFEDNIKSWDKIGKMLLEFSRSKFPDKTDLIYDSLCWDWCGIAGSHFYPPFLKPPNSLEWKKIGNKYFQQFKSYGFIKINEMNLSLKSIKKTIFYLPTSLEFCQKYNFTKSIYAFVPNNNQKAIIPISYL